jgi:hypothetical protein
MRGRPFPKGHKGPGRPKGAKNKATIAKDLLVRASEWIDGAEYFDGLKTRITRGRAPHAESYLLRRIKGDPTQHVELAGNAKKPLKIVVEVVRD